jgi:hypothetical protein
MKTAYWIGGGALAIGGIQYLRLHRMQRELIVQVVPRLQLPPTFRVTMRNPTQGSASLVQPQVAIYLSEEAQRRREPLVVSETGSRRIDIRPFGTVTFDVPFRLPVLQAPAIIRQLRATTGIIVETTSTILLFGGLLSLPYNRVERLAGLTGTDGRALKIGS